MGEEYDMGPLPKVHPRQAVVWLARNEINDAFTKAMARHGLTYAEQFLLLSEMLLSLSGSCIRAERRAGE
jgi:hypothetical protein